MTVFGQCYNVLNNKSDISQHVIHNIRVKIFHGFRSITPIIRIVRIKNVIYINTPNEFMVYF